jgi:hypothetical protein
MRIVIASTPAAGHVNAVAAIGGILAAEGHGFEDIGEAFFLPARIPTFRTSRLQALAR